MIGEEMKIIYAEGTTAPKQMNQMVKEQWIGIGRNKYNKYNEIIVRQYHADRKRINRGSSLNNRI